MPKVTETPSRSTKYRRRRQHTAQVQSAVECLSSSSSSPEDSSRDPKHRRTGGESSSTLSSVDDPLETNSDDSQNSSTKGNAKMSSTSADESNSSVSDIVQLLQSHDAVEAEHEMDQQGQSSFPSTIPENDDPYPELQNAPGRPGLRDIDPNLAEFEDQENEGDSEPSDTEHGSSSSDEHQVEDEESEEDDFEPPQHEGLPGIDPLLYAGAPITLGQSLLAILTFAIVHNLTGVAVADLLNLVALHCLASDNNCKRSLYTFRKYFLEVRCPIKYHYFCSGCFSSVPSKNSVCQRNCRRPGGVSFFIEIPILAQLSKLFRRQDFYQNLSFRSRRVKENFNNLEDVYDGRIYKEFLENGVLRQNSLSFCWNADGIKIYRSAKLQVWPLYLAINELPYNMRFKKENCILAGIWFGPTKPVVSLFLNAFHSDLCELYSGKFFDIPGHENPVRVNGVVLCGTCDMPAKSHFLNMKQYNGYYGCPKCKIRGERSARTDHQHAYPYTENMSLRSMEETKRYADLATEYKSTIFGIKGKTPIGLYVPDYIRATSIDVMHCIYEGVMKKLLQLWFDDEFSNENFSLNAAVHQISDLLVKLTPPSLIRRLPRSISDHLAYWKAQELKSFFFYYSLPLLSTIMSPVYLRHHMLLVHAIFLLNQESISNAMIDEAEACLKEYLSFFPELYHLKFMTINFHMLVHLADVVRDLGPLWTTSCMPFEDLNGQIKKLVHGTTHAAVQICAGLSQIISLPVMLASLQDQDPVGIWCKNLLKREKLKLVESIDDRFYTIGNYVKLPNIPPLITDAMMDANIEGNVAIFFRLKRGKLLFFSEVYQRLTKQNSTVIKLKSLNSVCYGVVHTYLRVSQCDCQKTCRCEAEFFAVVRILNVCNPFQTNVSGNQLIVSSVMRAEPHQSMTLVPVHNILSLCIGISVQNQQYVINPVNTREDE